MTRAIAKAPERVTPSRDARIRHAPTSCIGRTGTAGELLRARSRLLPASRFALSLALVLSLSVPATAVGSDRLDGKAPKDLGVPAGALPTVNMKAGALVTEDGRVLWSRREGDRRAMASITKIMTAVVALENGDVNESVTVPSAAVTVGESTSFLRAGERLAMADLLEALLVKSGNDAGVAIAQHVAGDETRFVALMNEKAKALGMKHTHFANSHGLDEDGHYSTASDLATLARYAMRKPEFREIVGEQYAQIGRGSSSRVQSTNLLLGNYDGANGIKTGFTNDAGYCVIASARRGGVELYAVVLGTANELARFREAKELLDWGFAHYREQKLTSAGTVVGESVVSDYLDVTVPAAMSRDSTIAVFDLAGEIERNVSLAKMKAPVKAGDRVGVATFTQGGTVVETVPLVATVDVARPGLLERAGIALVRAWRKVFGGPMTATAQPAAAITP